MVETANQQSIPTEQQTRKNIISHIAKIKQLNDIFDRCCFYHAITLLDIFQARTHLTLSKLVADPKDLWLVAFTSLWMCLKYMKGETPKLMRLLKDIPWAHAPEKLTQKIVGVEELILIGIEFDFPSYNAYEVLDSVSMSETDGREDTVLAMVSLKILQTAFILSPILSLDPDLGREIHCITRREDNISGKALELYKKCLQYLQQANK